MLREIVRMLTTCYNALLSFEECATHNGVGQCMLPRTPLPPILPLTDAGLPGVPGNCSTTSHKTHTRFHSFTLCSRIKYRGEYRRSYRTEYYSVFGCCNGYVLRGSWYYHTLPIAHMCMHGTYWWLHIHVELCVVYSFHPETAYCSNCDSNHRCIAPNACVCPAGWTGSDYSEGKLLSNAGCTTITCTLGALVLLQLCAVTVTVIIYALHPTPVCVLQDGQ